MCGICGVVYTEPGRVDKATLERQDQQVRIVIFILLSSIATLIFYNLVLYLSWEG